MFVLAAALYDGYTNDRLYELTKIDKWFLNKLRNIVSFHTKMEQMTASLMFISDCIRLDFMYLSRHLLWSHCLGLFPNCVCVLNALSRWRTCIILFCWRQSRLDFPTNRLQVPSKGKLYLLLIYDYLYLVYSNVNKKINIHIHACCIF